MMNLAVLAGEAGTSPTGIFNSIIAGQPITKVMSHDVPGTEAQDA